MRAKKRKKRELRQAFSDILTAETQIHFFFFFMEKEDKGMASKKVGCFTVPGKPHGKERPQFNSHTKKAYTPETQIEAEGAVRRAYYQAGYERLEFDELVRVDIICCYAPPESMSEAEKQALMGTPAYNGSRAERMRMPKRTIPDGDNCLKTILDGLAGPPKKNCPAAYKNDSQVVEASVRSIYGPEDCTQVKITVLGAKEPKEGDEE